MGSLNSLRKSLSAAFFVAACCTVLFALIRVVQGPEAFSQYGFRFLESVVLLWVTAAIAGSLTGSLLPLARSRVRSTFIGGFVGSVAMAPWGFVAYPVEQWISRIPVVSLLGGGLVGALVGARAWSIYQKGNA